MSHKLTLIRREIYREQKKIAVVKNYSENGRFIAPKDHRELKAKRECEECNKKMKHPPEIHHVIPVCKGGSNERNNLMAVCKDCHKKLDEEANK